MKDEIKIYTNVNTPMVPKDCVIYGFFKYKIFGWFYYHNQQWYGDFVTVDKEIIGDVEKEVVGIILKQISDSIKAIDEKENKIN